MCINAALLSAPMAKTVTDIFAAQFHHLISAHCGAIEVGTRKTTIEVSKVELITVNFSTYQKRINEKHI